MSPEERVNVIRLELFMNKKSQRVEGVIGSNQAAKPFGLSLNCY